MHVVLFPSSQQEKHIQEKYADTDICVLSRDQAAEALKLLTDPDVQKKILCGHEEALYLLRNAKLMNCILQFDPAILKMLTKEAFKTYLEGHGVLCPAWYSSLPDDTFPLAMKPIIGFGSIGVRYLEDKKAAQQILQSPLPENALRRIEPYRLRYFPEVTNCYIFEPMIEGAFYRTPFIVQDKKAAFVFPVRGIRTTASEETDFHWTGFSFGEQERAAAARLAPVAHKLTELFGLSDGVYVAEFIDAQSTGIYVLEFSPRLPSSRIAALVRYAAGLDLERIAVDLFFGRADINTAAERNIRMWLEPSEGLPEARTEAGESVLIADAGETVSVYGKRMRVRYYEKRH